MPLVRTIATVAIGSLALAGVLFAAAARPAAPPAAPQPKEPIIGPGGILMDPPAPPPAAPVPGQWTVCPAPGKFITCPLATDTALWVEIGEIGGRYPDYSSGQTRANLSMLSVCPAWPESSCPICRTT
jgi:hypothetical protein